MWLARQALPESKGKLVPQGLLWCVCIPAKTRDILPLHREQEASSAYGHEVEELDLPPGGSQGVPQCSSTRAGSSISLRLPELQCYVGARLLVPSALWTSGMGLCGAVEVDLSLDGWGRECS